VFEGIEAYVRGDSVQPRAEGRTSIESAKTAPCLEKGLLKGILGVVKRAQHPVAMHSYFSNVRFHQGLKGTVVAQARRR
jgi:hypothetical protein